MRKNEEDRIGPGKIIDTTFGRVLFNMILPEGMDFYNYTMKSSDLAQGDLRLLPGPRPPRDDRPAGCLESTRVPREHAQRTLLRHR